MDIRELLAGTDATDVKLIHADETLREAARRLNSHHIGALVVCNRARKLAGIVTERDLVRAITEFDGGLVERSVSEVMTRSVTCCAPDESIVEVFSLMKTKKFRHIPVIEDDELIGMVSIRELTRAYELLQVQADTDALTGLSNRRRFLETLTIEVARAARYGHSLSVAMIDVDHFKRINDTYGHEAGDTVLCALADLLVRGLRTIDRVGRLGGEEFAVLFPETDLSRAKLACDRLLRMIRTAEIDLNDEQVSFTVSIGLTSASPTAKDPAGILRRTDELLYEAKARGRNRVQMHASDGRRPVTTDRSPDARSRATGSSTP